MTDIVEEPMPDRLTWLSQQVGTLVDLVNQLKQRVTQLEGKDG